MESVGDILLWHKKSPTGFGINSRMIGATLHLRATSKCCGSYLDTDNIRCIGCDYTYMFFSSETSVNLVGWVPIIETDRTGIIEGWAKRLTGWPDLKLEVNK